MKFKASYTDTRPQLLPNLKKAALHPPTELPLILEGPFRNLMLFRNDFQISRDLSHSAILQKESKYAQLRGIPLPNS